MPHIATVMRWLAASKDFREQYVRARDIQADVLFDEIQHIADTPVIGLKTVMKATGVETTEGDMIEHRRLQIDARKWMLGKMSPKKYGDKTTIAGDPENPIAVENVTNARRKAALALLMAKSDDSK